MEPERKPLENDFPLQHGHFQVPCQPYQVYIFCQEVSWRFLKPAMSSRRDQIPCPGRRLVTCRKSSYTQIYLSLPILEVSILFQLIGKFWNCHIPLLSFIPIKEHDKPLQSLDFKTILRVLVFGKSGGCYSLQLLRPSPLLPLPQQPSSPDLSGNVESSSFSMAWSMEI